MPEACLLHMAHANLLLLLCINQLCHPLLPHLIERLSRLALPQPRRAHARHRTRAHCTSGYTSATAYGRYQLQ